MLKITFDKEVWDDIIRKKKGEKHIVVEDKAYKW